MFSAKGKGHSRCQFQAKSPNLLPILRPWTRKAIKADVQVSHSTLRNRDNGVLVRTPGPCPHTILNSKKSAATSSRAEEKPGEYDYRDSSADGDEYQDYATSAFTGIPVVAFAVLDVETFLVSTGKNHRHGSRKGVYQKGGDIVGRHVSRLRTTRPNEVFMLVGQDWMVVCLFMGINPTHDVACTTPDLNPPP
ncbi:hypothetical protein B0T16DRAFT_388356 [Cercophora newfieldiana]|uniref:Uncharacterized protein n=1 Tax=Cercophora newfieldiana TaxID=92897 RepID=A0AA40CSR3_9PEZI|nr:hypothetical protein B0T16DRAFT_388356 [Cercophora newfieldiana]